jgi:hypothetical protein
MRAVAEMAAGTCETAPCERLKRPGRGVYGLSPRGQEALAIFADAAAALAGPTLPERAAA